MISSVLERALAPLGSPLEVPRLLLIFAHPDDETLALGARLARLKESATLLHVTDGAPLDGADASHHGFASLVDYRQARREELGAALEAAGATGMALLELGIPDQQAAFQLEDLTQAITDRIAKLQPEVILTHPFEGGHPDHDATAFAVHAACGAMANPPLIVEAAGYHAQPDGCFQSGSFAPGSASPVIAFTLSPEEQQRKQLALARFRSQQETLCLFTTASLQESFRPAPQYDFRQAPAPAYYDRFPWTLKSQRVAELMDLALRKRAGS